MTINDQSSPRDRSGDSGRFRGVLRLIRDQIGFDAGYMAKLFAICFAAVFVSGFLLLTLITPKYSAITVIGPQPPPQGGNQGVGLNLDLGGLGAFFGGSKQSENLVAFQSILGTAEFAQYLIDHDHFDHIAFPNGIHHSLPSRILHGLFGQPVSNAVTVGNVQQFVQTHIFDQERAGTPYVQLLYADRNRAQAIDVLRIVLYSGDRLLRQRETTALDAQIAYLSHVLQTTSDVEQLNIFRNLMGQKLAAKVLVDTQATYAFKIFDAPFAPLTPNSPNLTMLMIVLIVVSLVIAATVTLARSWWMQRRQSGHS